MVFTSAEPDACKAACEASTVSCSGFVTFQPPQTSLEWEEAISECWFRGGDESAEDLTESKARVPGRGSTARGASAITALTRQLRPPSSRLCR